MTIFEDTIPVNIPRIVNIVVVQNALFVLHNHVLVQIKQVNNTQVVNQKTATADLARSRLGARGDQRQRRTQFGLTCLKETLIFRIMRPCTPCGDSRPKRPPGPAKRLRSCPRVGTGRILVGSLRSPDPQAPTHLGLHLWRKPALQRRQ